LLQEEVFDENLGGGVSFQLQLDQVVVYLVFQGEGHLFQRPQEADERGFQAAETNPTAPQGVEIGESLGVPFFLLTLAGEVAAEPGVRNRRVRKVRSQSAVGQSRLSFGVDLAGDQLVDDGRIRFHLAKNPSLIAITRIIEKENLLFWLNDPSPQKMEFFLPESAGSTQSARTNAVDFSALSILARKNRCRTKRGHLFSYDHSAMGIVADGEVLTILWSRFNDLPPPRDLEVVEVLVDSLENTFVVTAQFLGCSERKRGAVYALSPKYLPFSYFSLPFSPAAAEMKNGCLAIYPVDSPAPELFTPKGLKPGEVGKMTAPPSVFFSQPCPAQELSLSPLPAIRKTQASREFSPRSSPPRSPFSLNLEEKKKLAASAGRGKELYSKEDLLRIASEAGVEVYRSWSKGDLVEAMRHLWL